MLSRKKDGRKNLLLIENNFMTLHPLSSSLPSIFFSTALVALRKPPEGRVLHLEYLYASPLDLASLDVRAEIEALATIPGVNLTVLALRAGGEKGMEDAEVERR